AWFQLAEPRRGLFPGGGSTVQSVRQLTWCHAMEVVLLAERISAARAHEMGLVNRVVPRDRVLAEARKLAETICLNGPLAVRACKRSAKESTFLPLKEALANEMSYSASVFMSEDAKEGIKAFKEKRAPVWRGRGAAVAPPSVRAVEVQIRGGWGDRPARDGPRSARDLGGRGRRRARPFFARTRLP